MQKSNTELESAQVASAQNPNSSANGHGFVFNRTSQVAGNYPGDWSGELSAADRDTLQNQSAVSAEAIAARGYFTTSDRGQLKKLGFKPAQCLVPALVIPLWNWCGERAGVAIRPHIPRNDTRSGKPIKYETPAGAPVVLDVAPLTRAGINDPTKRLLITEGAKKADAAGSQGFCCINLNGVYGFRDKNTALPDWENVALKDRAVFVAYDSDAANNPKVETALRRLCGLLQARGAVVKVVYLPKSESGAKIGLDDFFARGHTVAELFALARDLAPLEESRRKLKAEKNRLKLAEIEATGLPVIETHDRQLREKLRDLSDAIAQGNIEAPCLFVGAAGLVRLERDATAQLRIIAADAAMIQTIAAHAANWISTNEKFGVQHVNPPRDLCQNYLSFSQRKEVPALETIKAVPFFAANGTLCANSGYYEAARTYLDLPAGFTLPDTMPTAQNIAAAKTILLETVLGEVAFADDASRAHAVALMILPFVRDLIEGSTPLHLWDAPERGSGKTYGAALCISPFARPCPTTEKDDKAEWRKSLFTELLEGASHIFIDNVKSSLNSAALDAMLTAPAIRERILGGHKTATVPVRCTWVATSNNAQLTPDIVTRVVVIRLDPDAENPDLREFKNDPERFIWENRGQVCGAIITLVRAWLHAGQPAYRGTNRHRFTKWRDVIGGVLDVAGVPGFLANVEEQRALLDGGQGDDWANFADAWFEEFGERFVTVADLLPIVAKFPAIEAIAFKAETEAHKSRALARALQHRRDRVFGGFKLVAGPKLSRQSSFALRPKLHTTHTTHTTNYPRACETFSQEKEEKEEKEEKSFIYAVAKGSVPCVRSVQPDQATAELAAVGVEYEI